MSTGVVPPLRLSSPHPSPMAAKMWPALARGHRSDRRRCRSMCVCVCVHSVFWLKLPMAGRGASHCKGNALLHLPFMCARLAVLRSMSLVAPFVGLRLVVALADAYTERVRCSVDFRACEVAVGLGKAHVAHAPLSKSSPDSGCHGVLGSMAWLVVNLGALRLVSQHGWSCLRINSLPDLVRRAIRK